MKIQFLPFLLLFPLSLSLAADPPSVTVTLDEQMTLPAGSPLPGSEFLLFGVDPASGTKLVDFAAEPIQMNNGHVLAAEAKNATVLIPGGKAVPTGVAYNNGGGPNSDAEIARFSISNPAVTAFSVWVLDSTLPVHENHNASVAIRVNGNEAAASSPTVKTEKSNEYTKFTIKGASISDEFTVSVRSDDKDSFRTLAGLCFAALPGGAPPARILPRVQKEGWLDFNKNGQKDIYEDAAQSVEVRLNDLMSQMTLEEKIGQLSQIFSEYDVKAGTKFFDPIRRGEVSSFIWASTNIGWRNQLQRIAVQESRLGIPIIFGMDIIHGAQTLFPIGLGLSCAFEPELFEKSQAVAAREARAEGLEWVFAPMADVARDPRWGRVAETCGEDPYLASQCVAAMVKGFQGDNPAAPDKVAACLKHYVGYSAVTGGRDKNDTEVTEWTLRNVHLPPFHAGVEAGALTIMSGFNTFDGIPVVANRHLLTEILRDEWKFGGFTVSDWSAVKQMINWGYAKDLADAARLAINAGTDMDMLSEAFVPSLVQEVKAGRVSPARIDEAVRRVLRVKFAVGLFERPFADEAAYRAAQMRSEDLALARECVAKSAVLLKNSGVLPLSPDLKKIALIGPVGDDPVEIQGCWPGRSGWGVTLAKALKDRLAGKAEVMVVKGCDISSEPRTKTLQDGSVVLDESAAAVTGDVQIDEAIRAAEASEVVVMALGEPRGWTGEGGSRMTLSLGGQQQALFDAVAATGKPVVAVIFSGRPLSLPTIWDKAAAVFYVWQPGIQAGPGITDLLTGDVAPTGRLSMSVLRDVGQAPNYYNYLRTGLTSFTFQDHMKSGDAQYWFGYGLTYTTFAYSGLKITPAAGGRPAEASVTIENTGDRAGSELAQLYISQLACPEGTRPRQELRGFQRVPLEAGAKVEVTFPLTGEVLGYVDRQGQWRADAGDYEVWISPSAHKGIPVKFRFAP